MRTIPAVVLGIVAVILLVIGFWYWQNDVEAYETYENTRYNYEIEYPAIFTPQGEPQNGDGQVFSGDSATLRVFGVQNTNGASLRSIAEQYFDAEDGDITIEENLSQSVQLRSEEGDAVKVVRAIALGEGGVGVAMLEYQDMFFDSVEEDVILTSFQRSGTDGTPGGGNGNGNGGTGDGSGGPPVGYRAYQSAALNFSMIIPEDATVSSVRDDRVQFTLLGPNNDPNTEITDGFTLTVFRDDVDATYNSVLAYAQAVVSDTRGGSENTITRNLERRTVSDMTAYRYSYRGALGNEVTEYIFLPDAMQHGYRMTYAINDPQSRGYQTTVFTMLESVRFMSDMAGGPPTFESVELALLDYPASNGLYTDTSDGPMRGCDRVVMVDRAIEPTTAPLTAALNELFSIETQEYAGWQNFIAKTNDTLSFNRAQVENGTAHIYLEGELSGLAGVCDNPRAMIQIEETALQFSTVDDVVFYLNGEQTDIVPDQSGL